jgi:hypothetical protein
MSVNIILDAVKSLFSKNSTFHPRKIRKFEKLYFFRNHAVPFSKMLTFYKADAFSVTAEYVSDVPIPDKQIGVFDISMIILVNSFNFSLLVPIPVFFSLNFCFGALAFYRNRYLP